MSTGSHLSSAQVSVPCSTEKRTCRHPHSHAPAFAESGGRALRVLPVLLATALALLLVAAPLPGRAHDGEGSGACPAGTERFTEIRLFFGRNRGDTEIVSEAEWQTFLAKEVTPRFPDGLTVMDATGQWRDSGGTIIRERSKLVIVLVGADATERTMEIIRAYKRSFGQESVLRSVATVCAGF